MFQIDTDRRRWWILAAMGGVMGGLLLDETVVGVALPTVRADLRLSVIESHWVINAYLLVFAGLAAAGGKLCAIYVERRVTTPLIEVSLFRGATFSASNLVIFTAQFNQISIVIFGALYLQHVLGMSPLVAGLALLTAVGAAPFAAVPTGRLADRIGARPVALGGLVLTVAGMLWIALSVDAKSYGLLVPGLALWGAANCSLYVAPRRAAVNTVRKEHQGQTGGIMMTVQLLGGTMGVAVCGTLFAMTVDYQTVFLAAAGLTLAVLGIAWLSMERNAHPPDHN